VEKKHDGDDDHGQGELEDGVFQGVDGLPDQIGSIIGRDDLNPLGQAGHDICSDLLLHTFNHVEDVLAEPYHDDTTRHLPLPIQIRQPPPDLGAKLYVRNVLQVNGCPRSIRSHRNRLQILQALNVSPSSHRVLDPGELDHPSSTSLLLLRIASITFVIGML